MTGPPLVSIIVNNYNYGRFVGEAIDSALAQTYPNVEVIVVDDGSTDNSREVIARYGSGVTPIFKENAGQGSAMNTGFADSKGEFILFLDSDDVLRPNAVGTAVREWRDGASRICFQLKIINAKGKPTGKLAEAVPGPGPTAGPFVVGGPTSGNFFSRDALLKVMPIPEEDWRICADTYLCAASSLFGEVLCLAQPLGEYRVHGGNNFQGVPDSLARTRRSITYNLNLYAALAPLAGGGIGSLEEWLGSCPEHWVRRITSLRESPQDHPWPDTLPGLTARTVRAVWRRPGWSVRKRAGYTIYAIGYGLLPGRAHRRVRKILRFIDGRKRGRTVRRFVGA